MADELNSGQENRKKVEQAAGSASSVWSLCDDSDHVDLGDITPSISPVVFTDDQVRQITQQNSVIDVLSPAFLPEEQINDVQLLMTCASPMTLVQDAVRYSAADLGSGFQHDSSPLKRDVLLHDGDDLKLDLFPGLSAIGELGEQKISQDSEEKPLASKGGRGDGKEELGKSTGRTYSLRRSPRKQPQQKNDSKKKVDSRKGGAKSKDSAEPSEENAGPAGRRRSPRNKVEQIVGKEKEERKNSGAKVDNSTSGPGKVDQKKQETGLKQEELSKNVRRSPRIQKKPEKDETGKGKQASTPKRGRGGKKQDQMQEVTSSEDDKKGESQLIDESTVGSDEKEGSDNVGKDEPQELKGQVDLEKEDATSKKSTEKDASSPVKLPKKEGKSEKSEKNEKSEREQGDESSSNDKDAGRRRSSRVARHRQRGGKEVMENDRKAKENSPENVSSTVEEAELKCKDKEEVLGRKGDVLKNEGEKKRETESAALDEDKDEAMEEVPLSQLKSKTEKEQKVLTKSKDSKGEKEEVTAIQMKKDSKDSEKVEKKKEQHESEPRSKRIRKATEKGREYFQEGKRETANKTQDIQEEEEVEEEVEEDVQSSESEPEEDDSDYDPENDPERLWCICRQPHGNRFMICCDSCELWFHGDCVGISMSQGRQMEKIGKEYVCPKCTAGEKESTGPKPEPGKAKGEGSKEKGEGRAGRRHKYRRLKMPTDPSKEQHKRRRHSSKEHDKEGVSVQTFYKSDEDRKRGHESAGFKIPKKVRTTPTPVSYKMNHSQQQCLVSGCSNLSQLNSLYCSDDCIQRHADESLRVIHAEKQKQLGRQQLFKSATSPSGKHPSTMHWETSTSSPVTSSGEPHSREGVAVWEKSTGRVIAGMAAPSEEELVSWLKKHPTFSVLKPTVSKEDRKKEKKDDEKTIRENVRRSLKEILTTRGREVDTLHLNSDDITKCATAVEEELFKVFSDTGSRYKNKYRSLMFNLKDPRNKALFQHVLTGEIPADRFVRMTPEQLASHELAKWREREVKHTLEMIKQTQESSKLQVMKKTHKGEVAIDEDEDMSTLETTVKPAAAEPEEVSDLPDSNTSSSTLLIDTTEEHRMHLFDLNCRICTGKITPPGEPPKKEPAIPLVSTTTIVQAVAESSIPSPPPTAEVPTVSSPDSVSTASVAHSPTPAVKVPKKASAVWKGFVMMGGVAKFSTHAYRVSGPCDDLLQLLPDTLHVQGRIRHAQVWNYIHQLKASTSRDVSIIRYEASSDEEKISYASLYSYFYSRKRCGVISNCYSGVKDMYVVPLASHQPVPPELLPFNGPGLDEPRPHMLLGIIVRTKAAFKRPRPISQRPVSPPRKRRPSSGSTGSGNASPLRDSPVAEIDDIVFQFNSGQAKKALSTDETTASKKSAQLATVAETTSSTTTPSEASSSAQASPGKETAMPLDVQKQQLLELQERARHYILAQVQAKGAHSGEGTSTVGLSEKTSEGSEPYNPEEGTEDDAPYDPEEELVLDLEPDKDKETRPLAAASGATGLQPAVPSTNAVEKVAAKTPLISLPILANFPSTAPQVSVASSSILVPSSVDRNSGPGPQKPLSSLMEGFQTNVASTPGSLLSGQPQTKPPFIPNLQSSIPPLMQISSGPNPSQGSRVASSPVPGFQGTKPGMDAQDDSTRTKAEGATFDRPRSLSDGLSQQDRRRPHPTPGESRFARPEPQQAARTVGDLGQHPPEGPHSHSREGSYMDRAPMDHHENRVPPQQGPGGPHQRAPYENAPPHSRDFEQERLYHGRDPRARDPDLHDNHLRDRRDPYGPPRRWSEGDRQRDRERWRDREPYGRYEEPYDDRRRYDDFRRDDRRHEQYRRGRWRR